MHWEDRLVRIKICGITRPGDGEFAAQAGADAIGLVFYSRSSRCVTVTQAGEIARRLPPFITRVGLFVNHDPDQVTEICKEVELDLLQFHGDETAEYCEQFGRRYVKAVRMAPGQTVTAALEAFPGASGLLLDGFDASLYGGSGRIFDWQRIPKGIEKPLILAGGLHAGNVAEAIGIASPYAVDVSSGVESAPGVKSDDKIRQFIKSVRDIE